MQLPFKTADTHASKGETKLFESIWFGANGRSMEVFVGTKHGVVKRRAVKRLPAEKKWDAKMIHGMEGTTWQPVSGHKSNHVPSKSTLTAHPAAELRKTRAPYPIGRHR